MFRTAACTRLKLVSVVDIGCGPETALDVPDNEGTVTSHAGQLWTGRTDAAVTDSELTLVTAADRPLTFTGQHAHFTFHAGLHQPISQSVNQ